MKSIYSIRSRAVAIFISCCALGIGSTASAIAPAPPARPAPNDTAARARSLIQQIEKAGTAEQRLGPASELAALRPAPIAVLEQHLARTRSSSDADRRAVLEASGADVPDENGRFATPQRQKKTVEKKNDNFDWLPAIAKLDPMAGLGEVVSDVAVIRALAASENPEGGKVIVDFAFSEVGLVYRDECGRYLRNMSPYSLPALIRGSQSGSDKSMKRYTTYQLERIDRQNPHKAFAAAPTEALQIEIVKAFADSQYRESVYAVLDNVDHVAPRVRAAVRAAWMEFVSGKEPPKPPERKLEMPNGKLSDEKEPLWLDHRALAKVAIQERLEELTGKKTNKSASLTDLTDTLFKYYDSKRRDALNAEFEAAMALLSEGKTEEATLGFDRILARNPEFAKRAEMAPAYLARAEQLDEANKFKEASVAYGKASALAPDNAEAKAALKKHHMARANQAKSEGKDATAEMAIADEIKSTGETPTQSKLILFAGLAALAGAIVLLILGLAMRRRPARAR